MSEVDKKVKAPAGPESEMSLGVRSDVIDNLKENSFEARVMALKEELFYPIYDESENLKLASKDGVSFDESYQKLSEVRKRLLSKINDQPLDIYFALAYEISRVHEILRLRTLDEEIPKLDLKSSTFEDIHNVYAYLQSNDQNERENYVKYYGMDKEASRNEFQKIILEREKAEEIKKMGLNPEQVKTWDEINKIDEKRQLLKLRHRILDMDLNPFELTYNQCVDKGIFK